MLIPFSLFTTQDKSQFKNIHLTVRTGFLIFLFLIHLSVIKLHFVYVPNADWTSSHVLHAYINKIQSFMLKVTCSLWIV